jgi:hypothetical protein
VSAKGSYTLVKFSLRGESDMLELRTAKEKMYFNAVFGSSGEAAPALDDNATDGIIRGEQDGLDIVRSGVTYEQLRSYAREDLRRLDILHGVPLTDGQQARTTARKIPERMDIVPAENSDATDDDEEMKEVHRQSPLTFEADGDFASEVQGGLYTGWFLKRTRPMSAIRDACLNLDPTLRSLSKEYSNAASHGLAVSTDIPKEACELSNDTPLESSATMLSPPGTTTSFHC